MSNNLFYTYKKMRPEKFKGKNVENSIEKLNRYFDNVFENVDYFDGAQAAVFRKDTSA